MECNMELEEVNKYLEATIAELAKEDSVLEGGTEISFDSDFDVIERTETSDSGANSGSSVKWDNLEAAYNALNTEYTSDLQALLHELESIDIRRNFWIESAYKADTSVAETRMAQAQEWAVECENYIDMVKGHLTSCFELIKETLEKFQHTQNSSKE